MVKTNDIYFYMTSKLATDTYLEADLQSKMIIIDQYLTKYTITKMRELGLDIVSRLNDEWFILELLAIINHNLKEEEKEEFFRHYTHYFLSAATLTQNYQVIWCSEKNLVEPEVTYNQDNMVDEMKTPFGYDPFKCTALACELYYSHPFIEKEQTNKNTRNR